PEYLNRAAVRHERHEPRRQLVADRAGERAANVRDAHRLTTISAVPVRDDDLVRDWTRQEVPEHVHAPRGVVLDRGSVQVPEPLKREARQPRTRDDQVSGFETVSEQRTR